MITDYLKAGYPVLMVRTHEPERFIGSMVKKINGRTPYQWDIVRGYRELGNGAEWQECDPFDLPQIAAPGAKKKRSGSCETYHFTIKEPGVIQAIQNNLPAYKAKGITLVMVAPDAELARGTGAGGGGSGFSPAHPGRVEGNPGGLEDSTGVKAGDEDMVLDAAQGLTWEEAENAMALALVRQKCFDPKTITELKAQMVKKSAALEFSQFKETFETLGGLENLKDWTLGRFEKRRPGLPFRGILLLGIPGTGKSHFAKALGNQVGWPCLSLNLGKIFGSLVGESRSQDAGSPEGGGRHGALHPLSG